MKRLFALLLSLVLWTTLLVGQQGMGPGPGVKSYAGGGTDFVTDTFTQGGTGVSSLNSHTGELGATWTQHPHANYAGGPVQIDADLDRVYCNGTCASYASGTPASANYQVCADFYHVTTIAVNIAVAGRMDTTADTMYILRLTDGTTWTLRRNLSAAGVNLGTSTNQIPAAGGASKRACLVMAGDQISATVEGVTEIGPITNSDITAAGLAGIRTTGASTATTGMHIDNFSAKP